jgi:hypothetical protein
MKRFGLVRIITIETIQFHAYLIAEQDGFRQSTEYYWFGAKMKLGVK